MPSRFSLSAIKRTPTNERDEVTIPCALLVAFIQVVEAARTESEITISPLLTRAVAKFKE